MTHEAVKSTRYLFYTFQKAMENLSPREPKIHEKDVERYSRQIIVPMVGTEGQEKLAEAKVLIVGLGGLGSPVLMYLATAGVGTIGIVDYDKVELHNLQRQVIHGEEDVGRNKTESAAKFASRVNLTVKIVEHNVRLDDRTEIAELVKKYDVIADCCDNVGLRYKLNDACRVVERDLVSASALRWEGQVCVIARDSACYRCTFPEMKTDPPSCETSGVIGPMCGVIGSIQANEVLKMILLGRTVPKQTDGTNVGKLILYNGFINSFKIFQKSYKICTVCKTRDMGSVTSAVCECDESVSNEVLPWAIIMESGEYAIVDIRSSEYFQMFRVHDSVNIPDVAKEVERIRGFQRPVVVTCYRGVSSRNAVKVLRKNGIEAYSAQDGMEGFKEYMKSEQ